MKNFFIFLFFFQTTIYYSGHTQLIESFSDGDFVNAPIWTGDDSNFIINTDNQLQLLAPAILDASYLTTTSNIIDRAQWSFYVKLNFNPSSSNYLDVYLVSDNKNLKEPLNGYFVRIGNSQDEVSLYKQSGQRSSSEKIIDGQDDRINTDPVELNISVTKSAGNTWELLVDPTLSGSFISEGTTRDGEHFFSKYMGILCTYTSTRSDKFYFDDLIISGEAYIDNEPPGIDSIAVLTDSTLHLFFNEKLSPQTALDVANYAIDKSIGNPYQVDFTGDSSVLLYFSNRFVDQTTYQLTINGIEDLLSNRLTNYTTTFVYQAPYIIGFGDILITEIMADPTPGIDLPEYEYLEIHNPKAQIFNLNQVKLIAGNDTTTIPDLKLSPNDYVILCQYSAVDQFELYGTTIRVPNWPSLNNRDESIILLNQRNEIVFSVEYNDSWYKSIDKDDGGWSLEMIDTSFPCKGIENWTASSDPRGGTPGSKNLSDDMLTDLTGPEINKIFAASDTSIIVYLNENIGPGEILAQNISIAPALDIQNLSLAPPGFREIDIDFSTEINPNTRYEVSIRNLSDCVGNLQKETSSDFVLPGTADSLDLIINEILFNPPPGGVDFVELFNQSEKYLDLKQLMIGNADNKPISEDHFIIEPQQFIALTEDPGILMNHFPHANPNNILLVENMPPFNDDEGNVVITGGHGNQLDFFQYSDDYHSDFLQDTEGVSLERISYGGPTNNPNNWQSAASTAGFATPGEINSQYFTSRATTDVVTVDPQVFDPGNNGFYDFTTISCRLPGNGYIASIQILDAAGRKIKTILSHKSIGPEEDFKWEGIDDKGQDVRMGYYIVYVEIYNGAGARNIFRKKVVVGGRL